MKDDNQGWRSFQKLSIDSKQLSKHAKKVEGVTTRHIHKFVTNRIEHIRDARYVIFGWLAAMTILIASIGLQIAHSQSDFKSLKSSSGGTYSEGSLGPIATLNPLYLSSSAEETASQLIFSSLYKYDTTGHLKGDLATNMKVDESGKTYVVSLRDNAYWHDGKPLTADDIEYTIKLIKDPSARSPLRINWQDVNVKAINKYAVEFKLPAVYASFNHALTFPVLPKHILGKVDSSEIRENAFSNAPIGSGPFKFKLLQLADKVKDHKVVHLIANDDYYSGRPKLNRFEIHAYADQKGINRALQIGELSGATDVNSNQLDKLVKSNYNLKSVPNNSAQFVIFNNTSPILSDLKVRKALQIGTDVDKIRKSSGDESVPLDLPLIPNQLTNVTLPKVPKYNFKEAEAQLDAAGWAKKGAFREKDGKKLSLSVTTIKTEHSLKIMKELSTQWLALGVDFKSNVVDTSVPNSNFIQTVLQPRNYDVLLYRAQLGADPDVYAYWHSSQANMNGYNFANYKNSSVDAALTSARSRLDTNLRNAKYVTFLNQWIADAPAIALYQQSSIYASFKTSKTIEADQILISPSDRFASVLYWSVDEQAVYKTP